MQDDLLSENALSILSLLFELLKYEPKSSVVVTPTLKKNINGCVYILSNGQHYKIGATRKLEERLRQLKLQNGDLELIHTVWADNYYALEQNLHQRFENQHINREWFALTSDDIEWIMSQYPPISY